MSGRQERLNIILLRELLALGAFFLLISTAMAQSGNLGEGEESRECRNCHQENKRPGRYDAIRPWLKSRHAEAGVACVDCHLKKEMEKEDFYKAVTATTKESAHAFMVERPAAKETKMYFVGVCGGCHKERLVEFNASVHGIANQKGKNISCIDCHDPHSVSAASNTDSRLYKGNDLKTCGRCHKDMLDSYMSTFHGKQFVLGNTLVPTCAYCHMGHELPPDDPGSALNAKNIGNICAGCHGEAAALGPDADEMMIHTLSRDSTRKVTHFRDPVALGPFSIASVINSSYITMIIGVVGFFTLMSTRDFIKKTKMTYSHRPGSEEKTINRFSLVWRLQHFFWAIAFIVLAATGLSLKFPDSISSGAIVWAAGGPAMRSVVHRIAAIIFIGTALAHIIPYI
ncbi:MAG: cytochrome c3 family protein, partial [Deltaproteobacteria bacterium]